MSEEELEKKIKELEQRDKEIKEQEKDLKRAGKEVQDELRRAKGAGRSSDDKHLEAQIVCLKRRLDEFEDRGW